METKWRQKGRQNGDKNDAKWRQNGDKNLYKLETKLIPKWTQKMRPKWIPNMDTKMGRKSPLYLIKV